MSEISKGVKALLDWLGREGAVDSSWAEALRDMLERYCVDTCQLSESILEKYNAYPDIGDLFSRLGYELFLRGDWEAAVKWYERDFEAQRMRRWQFLRYLNCLLQLGRASEALAVVDEYYVRHGDAVDGYSLIAVAMAKSQPLSESVSLFEKDDHRSKMSPNYRIEFAWALNESGQQERAFSEVEKAYGESLSVRDGYFRLSLGKSKEEMVKFALLDWDRGRSYNEEALRLLVDRFWRVEDFVNFEKLLEHSEKLGAAVWPLVRDFAVLNLTDSLSLEKVDALSRLDSWAKSRGVDLKALRRSIVQGLIMRGEWERLPDWLQRCDCEHPAFRETALRLAADGVGKSVVWYGFGIANTGQSVLKEAFFSAMDAALADRRDRSQWISINPEEGLYAPSFFWTMSDSGKSWLRGMVALFSEPRAIQWLVLEFLLHPKKFRDSLAGLGVFLKVSRELMKRANPRLVVFWGDWQPTYRLLSDVLRKRKTVVRWMDHSMVPGFLLWNKEGHNAALPELERIESVENPDRAASLLKRFSISRLSNKEFKLRELPAELNDDPRRKVFVAGVHSVAIRLRPRWTRYSRQFCPGFSSNADFLRAVTAASVEHGFVVLYKPHPGYAEDEQLPADSRFRLLPKELGIGEVLGISDVVATLGSGVSYQALARNLPCVLAAKNALWGTGCCYEVRRRPELESAIRQALANGLIAEQAIRFSGALEREVDRFAIDATCEDGRSVARIGAAVNRLIGRGGESL